MERHTIIVCPFERSCTKMRKIYNKIYGQNHKLPIQRIELIFKLEYVFKYWSVTIEGNLDQFIKFIQNYVIFEISHKNISTLMVKININNIIDTEFVKEIPIRWNIDKIQIDGYFSGIILKTHLCGKYELTHINVSMLFNTSNNTLFHDSIGYIINNCSGSTFAFGDITYNKKRTNTTTIDLNNKLILRPSARVELINFGNTIRKLCVNEITDIIDTSIIFPNLTSFRIFESIDNCNQMKLFDKFLNNNKSIYKFEVYSVSELFDDAFVSNKIIKYLSMFKSRQSFLVKLLNENTTLEKIKIIITDESTEKIKNVCDNFRSFQLETTCLSLDSTEKIITSNIIDANFRISFPNKGISNMIEKHQDNVILAEILINSFHPISISINSYDEKKMKRLLIKQKTLQYLCDDETSVYKKYTQYKSITN